MEQLQLVLKRYHWVITLVMLTLIAQMVGRGIGLLIEGLLPAAAVRYESLPPQALTRENKNQVRSLNYYNIITDRNLFNSNPPDTSAPTTTAPTTEVAIGKLKDKAKVRGTIVGEGSAMAMIEVLEKKEVGVYLPGDLIIDGAEITAIQEDGVVYTQGGEQGFLPLDESDTGTGPRAGGPPLDRGRGNDHDAASADDGEVGVEQVSDTEFIIDEAELQNQLANINQLILQARVVPNFSGGKIDGFKIFAIKPNSIFRKLGLRNGDVLVSVNGVLLDNPQKGLQVFQDLQGQRQFNIDLRRRAENMSYNYEVR
ncbi:MAG: hypothetical protein KDH09_05195 [Chrysiogenetes bacterium]|nr:hypothetical protein [Chrysiogenetes bacterium]